MKRILTLMRRWGRNAGGWLAPIALVVGLIALANWFEDATGLTLNLWAWAVIAVVLGVPALVCGKWARAWKQAQERPSFPLADLLWGTFGGGGIVLLIALASWFEDATGVTLNLWGWAVIAAVLGVPALVVGEWARAWKQAQERPSFPLADLLWGTFGGGGIVLLLALANSGAPSTAVDDDWRASAPTPTATPAPITTPTIRELDDADSIRVYREALRPHLVRLYDALDATSEASGMMADAPEAPASRDHLRDAHTDLYSAAHFLRQVEDDGQSACLARADEAVDVSMDRFMVLASFFLGALGDNGVDLDSLFGGVHEAWEQAVDALWACGISVTRDAVEIP